MTVITIANARKFVSVETLFRVNKLVQVASIHFNVIAFPVDARESLKNVTLLLPFVSHVISGIGTLNLCRVCVV